MESGILSIIKGSKQSSDAYVGTRGELVYEWDTKHVVHHDGTTVGGTELANTNDIVPTIIKNIDSIIGYIPTQLYTESIKSSNELTSITAFNDKLSYRVANTQIGTATNSLVNYNVELQAVKFTGNFFGSFQKSNSSASFNNSNEYVIIINNSDTAIYKDDSIIFNVPIKGVDNTSNNSFVTKFYVDSNLVSKTGSIIDGTISYTVFNNGVTSTTKTIDWGRSNIQKVTTNINTTFVFNPPASAGSLILKVTTGNSNITITFPDSVKWPYDDIPVLDKLQDHILVFMYIDDIYYANVASGYSL